MGGLESMLTLNDIDFKDKRVLARVDFNVPIDEEGEITDDFRIRSALPTINYILNHGASQLVLMTHLDPWKKNPAINKDPRLTTDRIATRLSQLIGENVRKVDDCVDIELSDDRIVMLENLRFHKEEEGNDDKFAKKLAKYGDSYVNDAFGTCHRAHASVDAVVKYFGEYCAGLLVKKEVDMLSSVLSPRKPFYTILGGSKVKDKIKVIESLSENADKIFIGGKMAVTFLDVEFLDEKYNPEPEERAIAKELISNPKYSGMIVLPVDYVTEYEDVVSSEDVEPDKKIFDVGPKTIDIWKKLMSDAKTLVWNGPLGYFEKPPFDRSTNRLVEYLSGLKNRDVTTIIGGGDSASAVRKLNLQDKMTHVSTGGGASLEFLEGKELPGLKALDYY